MLRLSVLFLTSVLFFSCSTDDTIVDPAMEIDNPAYYDFVRDGISSVSFSGQTARIGMATELIHAMKDVDQTSVSLIEMYSNKTVDGGDANPYSDPQLNESTKSIQSKVAASADFFSANTAESARLRADLQSWIEAQVNEVFANKNELATAGRAGQIADGSFVRYVNAQGLEYDQAINKSLIGALMVDQIVNNYLSPAVLDAADNRIQNDAGVVIDGKPYTTMEHKWDEAYGYLFGATSNPEDPLSALGEGSFLNKYLARVDNDVDFSNIASEIFEAFKLGRAAIVAGDYTIRDEQADIIKEKLSIVVSVRAVYYLQKGKTALSSQDLGGAFHDLSEGFGFVYSLRFLPQPQSTEPYFTRSEVDGYISSFTSGNGFWDLTSTTLDEMSESIAAKFDFTLTQAAH